MRFAFTEDQLAFRDAVRDLLAKECPPSTVREAWTNRSGRASAAWTALGEMGVLGALVPEAKGGLGLSEIDFVLLAEETGRAALPEPFVEHALVGAPLLATEAAATGTTTVTAGDPLVPYADTSATVVRLGHESFVVERDAATLTPHRSVDHSRRLFDVAATGSSQPLDPHEVSTAYWRGNLGFSAQLVGLGRHLLDTTAEYVVARHQFGAPIGSFQAIKHKLADVRIALEFAAPLVYRAAYSLTVADPAARTHVGMAKAASADAASLAARHALQCHGAMGYSFEYDLHLWIKRVWALAAAWGDAAWHRELVARAILDS
ncbi:MAG: acyl-CoA dehydrogenase family protein [Acidimicrobiia bacterium]